LPKYSSSGSEWLQSSALSDEQFGNLGSASTDRFGSNRMRIAQIVDAIKEFGTKIESVPVQGGVAFPPLSTPSGDLFIARIIATDPSREPKDLAEVREKVTADLEAIFRYDHLMDRLPELLKTARADGLRPIATEFDVPVGFAPDIREVDLNVLIQFGIAISGRVPGLGPNTADAVEAVVDHALELDPTKPVREQPADKRIFAVHLPDQLKVLLVSVDRISPLTKEQWDSLAANNTRLQQAVAQDMLPKDPASIFDFDALSERHDFAVTRSTANDDQDVDDEKPDADA
jgi:hypothetical protein